MLSLPALKVEFLRTVVIKCFIFIGSSPNGCEDDSCDGRKGSSKMFTKLWGSYPRRAAFLYRGVQSTSSSAHTAVRSDVFMKPYSLTQAVEIAPKA